MSAGLVAHNLSFQRFGRGSKARSVLDGIFLRLEPGRVTLVHGATGAGKTTLLHLLASLIRPTAGEIIADGEPVSRWAAAHRDRWRRQVGIAFQQAYLFHHLTALENVYIPLVPRGVKLPEMRRRGSECLSKMGIATLAAARPPLLSGGECQRVSIARAIVSDPPYLLLDEPTAFQDDEGVSLVCRAVEKARDNGAAVFICSHDARLRGTELVDAAYRLKGGRLVPGSQQIQGIR
jgi:ABC-type lipoprotein export system ATPase subunit